MSEEEEGEGDYAAGKGTAEDPVSLGHSDDDGAGAAVATGGAGRRRKKTRTQATGAVAEDDEDEQQATSTVHKGDLRGKLEVTLSANKIKKTAKKEAAAVEAQLFSRDASDLPDYQQRMDELGLNQTLNVHRKLPVLAAGACVVALPFKNEDSDRVSGYWRWVYATYKVLPRDVLAHSVKQKKSNQNPVYELATMHFAWTMKEWYWTPSFVYVPEYVDASQPVLISWLSNGDVVLLADKAMEDFADGSDDEAANALTFIGAFMCLRGTTKPDVRLVFQRSLNMMVDCRHAKNTDVDTLPESDGMKWVVNTPLDVMSWSVKSESDLSWRWSL